MKKQKDEPSSPVVALLDLVWASVNRGTGHSWERLNHSMRNGLELAIGGGFLFHRADIAHVFDNYRSGHWIGESDEWIYALAIEVGNTSAAVSFEAAKGRMPFKGEHVCLRKWGGAEGYVHRLGNRKYERLAVGFEFRWKGQRVTVTSFSQCQQYLTACSYKEADRRSERKIDRRFKITRDDLYAGRKDERERQELVARLQESAVNGKHARIIHALGSPKGQDELDAVPLALLRKVADKYAPPFKGPVVTEALLEKFRGVAGGGHVYSTARRRYPPGTPLKKISTEDMAELRRYSAALAEEVTAQVAAEV